MGCGPCPFPRTPTPGREHRLHRPRACVASGTRPGKGASRLLRCASALRVTGRVPAAETPLRAVSDGLWPIGKRAQEALRKLLIHLEELFSVRGFLLKNLIDAQNESTSD